MIVTYDPEIAAYWHRRNAGFGKALNFDGVKYWQIEVPKDVDYTKDPDYVQLMLRSKLFVYPKVIRQRLRPPVFTMVRGGFWVETRIGDKKETRAIPLSRSKSLIEYAYKGPTTNTGLQLKRYSTRNKLAKVLQQAYQEGIEHVALLGDRGHIEKVEIQLAYIALSKNPQELSRVVEHFEEADRKV